MLITFNEDILRAPCALVDPSEVDNLIKLLEDELKEINRLGKSGIGLAAPQIGISKQIAIIRLNDYSINLVNAQINKKYNPFIFKDEGCLSFPGRSEDTTRYKEVFITNNLVEPHNFIASGMLAVVCQHEIGHLNGDLFFDNKIIKQQPIINKSKLNPNDACVCNKINPITGKVMKYKKCCGK